MKVVIRIGDISSGIKTKYTPEKHDDINKEKLRMYNFLCASTNRIVEDVDNFMLYALNNGLFAYLIKDNPELKDKDYKNEACNLIPKFDPQIYKVFEIHEDGTETCLQDKEGTIQKNYFDLLMKGIIDDFYSCLTFYESKS